ncbi:MAG: T9SS type A sorting domain-containing protein [Bacteroidales bacterium]|nr:T9SS type A sorting domain-containing protein [Bacteroidales bacterium]
MPGICGTKITKTENGSWVLGGIYSDIYNNRNQLVLTCRAAGSTAILNVSAITPGCYLLRVMQGDGMKVVKVVVE